ncbi:MAG: hypothetical protein QM811_21495 [Pirellulales bacterium]
MDSGRSASITKRASSKKIPGGAYTLNNVTAKPNADGSYTIRFGGDANKENVIPIMPGWNYLVRLYRPQAAILDGKWTFPEATVVK